MRGERLFPSVLPFQNVPPDLSLCVFVIEQALSVRALQELMASGAEEGGAGGGVAAQQRNQVLPDEQFVQVSLIIILSRPRAVRARDS